MTAKDFRKLLQQLIYDVVLKCGLCFVLVLTNFQANSQVIVSGRVVDKDTKEGIAFVAISLDERNKGTYTDIDGFFNLELDSANDTVSFNFLGYEELKSLWDGENLWLVYLNTKTATLNEVTIFPGVNPAERIIQLAIDNKRKNDPEGEITFSYDSYNKLVYTAVLDTAVLNDPAKFGAMNAEDKRLAQFLDEQYVMLIESISHRKYMPPNHSEESIVATRVSGLTNPEFALLGTQLQSFSFYGETVNLLDNYYLSPLSQGAIDKYLFILESTTTFEKDTIYNISFRPRKGKNMEGMSGQLFISTNGYALQHVIAEPAERGSSFHIKIQQKYEWIENKKWFPVQLNSYFEMPFLKLNSFAMAGVGSSYIKNIKLGDEMKASEFTPVTLQMMPLANRQPDSLWNKYREYELDKKELRTYHVIDSVGKAENLDRLVSGLMMFTSGKLPWGNISFDLDRIVRFNRFEGFRFGLGIHTNDFLSKHFSIGGYYGYGLKDRGHKYGSDLLVHLWRKRNTWLKILYENDLMETAGNQFAKPPGIIDPVRYYQLYVNRMDRREKFEMQFNSRLIGNVTTNIFANHQFIKPYGNYRFQSTTSESVILYNNEFSITEVGIQIRYAPGEKLARMGQNEIRLGGHLPIFWFRYTQGLDNTWMSEYNYQRLDGMIEKTFRITNGGDLTLRAVSGYINADVPLPLLYNAQGSASHFGIVTPMSFETMRTNEFQHSEFAALHLRHNLKDILWGGKKFNPHLTIAHSMMVGSMRYPENHSVFIVSANHIFTESGFQLDNLLKSNLAAFGIGCYYRYGANHLPETWDNIAVKISVAINL